MGFKVGVGGGVRPVRAGVSTRGVGGALGPVSAGYAWRHGRRRGSITLGLILSWIIVAVLLGWLIVLAAVLVLGWPMIGAAAFQQFALQTRPTTSAELAMLVPETVWLALVGRWALRRYRRRASQREIAIQAEAPPTAWRPWS